jgi:6-phosphogluconolactonase (cycloisomerase 2 family)
MNTSMGWRATLVVASALLLAACGDGDDSNDIEKEDASHRVPRATACAAPSVATGPGGRIVAVADADMLATAYGDDQLGPPAAGAADALVLLDPSAGAGTQPAVSGSAAVSNAVTGPAWVFDVDKAGARAYVIETNPPPPAGVSTLSALVRVPGTALTVLDICDRTAPRAMARVQTSNSPTAVSLRPNGRLLAVASRFPARLVTHTIDKKGQVGPPVDVPLPAEILPAADNPDQEVTQAVWSPDGRWLAVFLRGSRKLQIYAAHVSGSGDVQLTPSGSAADIDEGSFGGQWSPDGRTLGVINVRALSRPLAELFALLPTLTPQEVQALLEGSVQVVDVFGADGQPAPRVVQTLPSPPFPEGLAFSPDGRYLATVNQQTTALPASLPLFSPLSTVSLYARDVASGQLSLVSNTPFEGILPESVAFDPTSRYLAVAVYHPTNADRTTGAIDLWRLVRDDSDARASGLERLSRTPGPRGLHVLRWVP